MLVFSGQHRTEIHSSVQFLLSTKKNSICQFFFAEVMMLTESRNALQSVSLCPSDVYLSYLVSSHYKIFSKTFSVNSFNISFSACLYFLFLDFFWLLLLLVIFENS